MPNNLEHWFEINCGQYPYKIIVFVNRNEDCPDKKLIVEAVQSIGNIHIDDIERWIDDTVFDCSMAIKFPGSSKQVLLYIDEIPKTITDLAILSHEVFHCTEFTMDSIGTKHCRKTSEPFAYLLDYLLIQLYEKLKIEFTSNF